MVLIKERIGKLLEYVQRQIYPKSVKVGGYRMLCSRERFADVAKLDTSQWERLPDGQLWGGHREYYWFETEAVIPREFDGCCVVYELTTGKEAEWDATNFQFLVYVDGEPRQGFDANHREILLTERARAGQTYRIVLFAFTGDRNFTLRLDSCLKVLDRRTEKYFYDLSVPYNAARLLPPDDPAYLAIIRALNGSLNLLDLRKEGSAAYYESLEQAQNYITEEFYGKYCDPAGEPVIYCVGHTHIDCAWLWTLKVTEDKAVRSFSTVLELMRRYPEYKFMSSQPQLYKFVKKNAPEVYRQIRERVKEGRWEPEGGMFVEADCNLASGESLVRQFLFGKRFFREEFGADNKILWLPDVFGYSAALPQIMKKCGLKYFMTTKISWSEFNKMPYDTFEWEGIDGSRVLTHFIPTRDYNKAAVENGTETEHFTSYNGYINPSQIKGAWARYSQKYLNEEALCSFGFGDGGGGPTKDMLENQRRLAQGIPGVPRTKMATAGQFFEELDRKVSGNRDLPVWVGELYLEYHRGTYTSMARNKKWNRRAEFLYQNAELYSVMNRLAGGAYPARELADGWEILLRNQFHDILPGSSIREVYEDSAEEYRKLFAAGEKMTQTALGQLARKIDAPAGSLVVYNPNSAPSAEPVRIVMTERTETDAGNKNTKNGARKNQTKVAGDSATGKAAEETVGSNSLYGRESAAPVLYDGEKRIPLQKLADGSFLFFAEGVPAKGYKTYRVETERAAFGGREDLAGGMEDAKSGEMGNAKSIEGMEAGKSVGTKERESVGMTVGTAAMENRFFRLEFNEKGQFSRIFDKRAGREVLKPGEAGNVIVSYEDRPHNYDAWDINNYYTEKSWEVDDVSEMEVTEDGPVRSCVRIRRSYLDSVITQYIYLYRELPRIDIRNVIDWKEHQILLKDYFPIDVHTNEATFEIQYGNVKRNTHSNTSWDFAKFEVCHHKWLDVCEDGYGVSILNDCKYGVSVRGSTVGLSMLKSPVYPNPDADKEVHEFTYSLFPHQGSWREAGTAAQAYRLNNPAAAVWKTEEGGTLAPSWSFVSSDQENVIIEAVKKAEDSGALIVRLYECWNRRTEVTLTFGTDLLSAAVCDMLEENDEPLETAGRCLTFTMRPYEIRTLKVEAARLI